MTLISLAECAICLQWVGKLTKKKKSGGGVTWDGLPSRGGNNACYHFMLQELELGLGEVTPVPRLMWTFF